MQLHTVIFVNILRFLLLFLPFDKFYSKIIHIEKVKILQKKVKKKLGNKFELNFLLFNYSCLKFKVI